MDYAPFQAWVTEKVINNPYRKASGITDYDPVHAGNVIPGELPISDPGQLGRANLPSIHGIPNIMDTHLNPSLPAADTLPTAIPRVMRWVAFRGGQYNPFSFTNYQTGEAKYQELGTATAPMAPTGAGAFEGQPAIHGPATLDDLESGAGVRQPRRLRQRAFLRRLFLLPNAGRTLDATGTHDEREIPQTGEDVKDTPYLTDAAVGVGNSFVVPDVRRTFDQPKDVPPGTPRDADGNPIYNKAGYRLTPTALQGSNETFNTSHFYPSYNALTETAIGSSAQRVRAGVQYDIEYTRPAGMPHWFSYRPFDQAIAHHNLALKGMLRPPSVSRPVMTTADDQSGEWSAGRRYSAPPAGMSALAIIPNIDRQAPQAWDTNEFVTATNAVDPRQSKWRFTG